MAVRSYDIELTPCDRASARLFAQLEAVAFPFPAHSIEERVAAILANLRCPLDRHFLARVDRSVVGGFRILPLEMRVALEDSGWIQVGGLGRLAVYPHHRRQGVAGGVLRLVLQRSYDQGDVISLLYPSSFSLYRRYGYAIMSRHVLYCLPPSGFPDCAARERIRPATPDDADEVQHCYQNQYFGVLGNIRRSRQVWRDVYLSRPAESGYSHWLYEDEGGRPAGYVSIRYEPTAKAGVQRILVNEWFVTSGEALRAILGFLHAQSANIELVKLPAPMSCALESGLVEPMWPEDPDWGPPHQPIGKLCSTLVGRIIRLEEAISMRAFADDGQINLLLEDWALPVNSGYYSLRTEGGRAELRPADEGDPDVRLDIAALSSLYSGAVTARQARTLGQIEAGAEAADQLDRMLGPTNFMVWDLF